MMVRVQADLSLFKRKTVIGPMDQMVTRIPEVCKTQTLVHPIVWVLLHLNF